MFTRLLVIGVLVVGLMSLASAQEKKKELRKGTVAGVLTAKGNNWIEVKADGEEKARKYFTGKNEAINKLLKATETGTRVNLEWRFGEGFVATKLEVSKKAGKDDKKDETRKGSVTGVVTAKGPNWIEVTADGEEKGRRYVPHWKGGLPKDGGGLNKTMLAKIKDTPLKSRVKLDWEFEELARVVKIEVLKKPEKKKDKK